MGGGGRGGRWVGAQFVWQGGCVEFPLRKRERTGAPWIAAAAVECVLGTSKEDVYNRPSRRPARGTHLIYMHMLPAPRAWRAARRGCITFLIIPPVCNEPHDMHLPVFSLVVLGCEEGGLCPAGFHGQGEGVVDEEVFGGVGRLSNVS